jgi:hypothetical protein
MILQFTSDAGGEQVFFRSEEVAGIHVGKDKATILAMRGGTHYKLREPISVVVAEIRKADAQAVLSRPVAEQQPMAGCLCGGGNFSGHTAQCQYEHFLAYSGIPGSDATRYAFMCGVGADCETPAQAEQKVMAKQ